MTKFAGSLDANVLLRLLLNDVPEQHQAAVNLLENSIRPFKVADVAIIELVFALENHYHFKRIAIQETIESLLSLPTIRADRKHFEAALPLFVKHSNLTFEACYLHVLAEADGAAPLWTFDKKLASRIPQTRQVTHVDSSMSYEMT